MKIWIDADAAPRDVKEITARAAKRLELRTILVANQRLWFPPGNPFLEAVRVEGGPDVADAYMMKLSFLEEFWDRPATLAEPFLEKWCRWARDSDIAPMQTLAETLWPHRRGLLRWYWSRISNGILEGLGGLLQAAKGRARGYRTTKNLIAMAYLIGGDFGYGLPT